jgi:Xaa-Pro aminopeptidase
MPKAYSFLEELNPKTKFVDAEALFWDLRSIKTPEEIQILKSALQITEMGLKAMVEGKVEGATIGELYYRYKMGVMRGLNKENAMGFEMSRAMISAGDHFASVRKQDYKISKGQSIYFDGGITLHGYLSDMGRTLVVGKPNDLQKKIFKALKAGYDAALEKLGPGVKMREIFEIAVEATRKSGLDWYTRGHMGHAVGVAPGAEQPPFISATEERVFEPGMVICVESPLYVNGLGGFQVEDEIVITKNGIEVLNAFPRDMVEVS